MSDRQTGWERLLFGVAQIVIAAMIIAIYTKMDEMGRALAVLHSQMEGYQQSKEGYYTRTQAEARHEEIFRTDKHQYGMLEDHEHRLRGLER